MLSLLYFLRDLKSTINWLLGRNEHSQSWTQFERVSKVIYIRGFFYSYTIDEKRLLVQPKCEKNGAILFAFSSNNDNYSYRKVRRAITTYIGPFEIIQTF